MKNVDTGVFTIIPESEEVDSATHHNYILNKDKSTVGDGCGTAAADVFVCSVCGDEYTVYKTITICRTSLREIKTIAKAALR